MFLLWLTLAACSGGHVGHDPCDDRQCGQVEGHDCGTCPGATDVCNAQGQCIDACAGRECGEVQGTNGAIQCGSCQGETEICDDQGQCADLCTARECGSPAPGIQCGTCTLPEQCGLSGHCYTPGGCPAGTVEVPDQGYCIDAFEVTNERMLGFMETSDNFCVVEEATAYNPTVPETAYCMTVLAQEEYKLWLDGDSWRIRPGYEHYPVVGVTWQGAMSACRAWGGELCTLPQWQLACTGPQGLQYPYGDEYDGDACNSCYWDQVCTPSGGIQPVGSYPTCEGGYPGLFDMSGNVFEWLWECKTVDNPNADLCVRVGGTWSGPGMRTGCYEDLEYGWDRKLPDALDYLTGFRCCYELP